MRPLYLIPVLLLAGVTLAMAGAGPTERRVPQSVAELWGDYDARREPLDVQVVQQTRKTPLFLILDQTLGQGAHHRLAGQTVFYHVWVLDMLPENLQGLLSRYSV